MAASHSDTLNRIFRLTFVKAGGLLLTLGLTMAQAAAFGAGPALDAFLLIRQSLASATSAAEGALHKLLVPHFLHRDRGWGAMAAAPVLVSAAVAALIWVFAPQAVAALAPGFGPDSAALAVDLTRILVLGLPVSILVAVLSSRAFARRRYSLVTAATLMPRVAGLAAFAAVGLSIGVTGLAWWIVGGMAAMGAIVLWAVLRPGPEAAATPTPAPAPAPDVPRPAHGRRAAALLVFFGSQIALTWSNAFLASLGAAGTAALLFLTLRLLNAAPGMANSAVSKVYYTEYAAVARSAEEARAAQLAAGLRTGLFFALPVAGVLLAAADPLIAVLLERGAFTAEDTAAMAGLVRLLVPVLVLNTVMAGLFTAALADDAMPLLRLTLVSSAAALVSRIAVGLWSVPALGLPGLALAIGVSCVVQTGFLALFCRWRWGALLRGPFVADCARLGLATGAGMAGAWLTDGGPLALRIGAFALCFAGAGAVAGVAEVRHLARPILRHRRRAAA